MAFGESCSPAPTSSSFSLRSKMLQGKPLAAKAIAAVRPAMPAPATMMSCPVMVRPDQVLVNGKAFGQVNFIAWEKADSKFIVFDVFVRANLSLIDSQMRALFPRDGRMAEMVAHPDALRSIYRSIMRRST